jgi:hypothetical protein
LEYHYHQQEESNKSLGGAMIHEVINSVSNPTDIGGAGNKWDKTPASAQTVEIVKECKQLLNELGIANMSTELCSVIVDGYQETLHFEGDSISCEDVVEWFLHHNYLFDISKNLFLPNNDEIRNDHTNVASLKIQRDFARLYKVLVKTEWPPHSFDNDNDINDKSRSNSIASSKSKKDKSTDRNINNVVVSAVDSSCVKATSLSDNERHAVSCKSTDKANKNDFFGDDAGTLATGTPNILHNEDAQRAHTPKISTNDSNENGNTIKATEDSATSKLVSKKQKKHKYMANMSLHEIRRRLKKMLVIHSNDEQSWWKIFKGTHKAVISVTLSMFLAMMWHS